jgi:23S rRNA pseudouridine2604 synthase
MDEPRTPDEPQRLSKVVAARMRCSRSEAEQYIVEGWVRVDGQRVEQPQFRVTSTQRVEVDPRARLQPAVPVTLLLHKPAGMTTQEAQALLHADRQWSGDPPRHPRAGGDPERAAPAPRTSNFTPLLPLPTQASGLSVFSQQRGVVRKLTEDAAFIEQELIADVTGAIAPDGLARLCHGLVRDGHALPPARVSWQSETRLRFAVKGIAPDAIGWMCAQVGLELTALRRIRIGRIPMAGLPAGEWRYLPPGERF